MLIVHSPDRLARSLNESPSEKEGKYCCLNRLSRRFKASMKALPKRKGNTGRLDARYMEERASMKALPKRKGDPIPSSFLSAFVRPQ